MDYLGTPEALDHFFTKEAANALGEHSRAIGLEPNVFVFQEAGWNDPDSAEDLLGQILPALGQRIVLYSPTGI